MGPSSVRCAQRAVAPDRREKADRGDRGQRERGPGLACGHGNGRGRLAVGDILNVLKGGVVEPAELVKGSWRYRVRTARIYVVVVFWSTVKLYIVTAWRKKTK